MSTSYWIVDVEEPHKLPSADREQRRGVLSRWLDGKRISTRQWPEEHRADRVAGAANFDLPFRVVALEVSSSLLL